MKPITKSKSSVRPEGEVVPTINLKIRGENILCVQRTTFTVLFVLMNRVRTLNFLKFFVPHHFIVDFFMLK